MALPLALRRSPDYVPPKRTAALLALLEVHQRDGRATVRSVAARAGITVGTAHWHLTRLANETDLVGGTGTGQTRQGDLRPLVEVVANG